MGHWTGIEEAANRYGVEVGELLSWQEIKDISFCKIGGTLMVDTDRQYRNLFGRPCCVV